ncbi:MAG TPA: mechanosensitive ion channel [Anaerolineae bacterium]|nr:mechanosensitive ion channel [Anaerolineae bacterium]
MTESLQSFLEEAGRFAPRLVAALVIFGLALLLSVIAARWAKRATKRRTDKVETQLLLSRLARWTVLVLGTIAALDIVDFDVTGFAAGLGIAGLTIGFALQDIARNFVAGILLLFRQPFGIGDEVQAAGQTGTVTAINTRDTVLRTMDGETIILPNLDVYTKPITNYSEQAIRRRTVRIGLGYDAPLERASERFLDALEHVEGVAADPSPTVYADMLGESSTELVARFWVNQRTHNLLEVHSNVVAALREAAEREGIDLRQAVHWVRVEGT